MLLPAMLPALRVPELRQARRQVWDGKRRLREREPDAVPVPGRLFPGLCWPGKGLPSHSRPRQCPPRQRSRWRCSRGPLPRELPLPGCWLQPKLPRGREPPSRSGLLLFRRISDCLSPLKVFRLEGNTQVLHRSLRGPASYFRENESIVTGSTGAPSVSLLPGVTPAAAIFDTTSRPEVTLPTTV